MSVHSIDHIAERTHDHPEAARAPRGLGNVGVRPASYRPAGTPAGDTPEALGEQGSYGASLEIMNARPTPVIQSGMQGSDTGQDPGSTEPMPPPSVGGAWFAQRDHALSAVRSAFEQAQARAMRDPAYQLDWNDESGPSFDYARFHSEWLEQPQDSLSALAALYGLDGQASLLRDRPDLLALGLRGHAGRFEGGAPPGRVLASEQELADLNAYLSTDMNRVLIGLFGGDPVESPTSALAQMQVAKYGLPLYEQLARLQQAMHRVQADYAQALADARNDPTRSAAGWHDVQVEVQVGGVAGESGWLEAPTLQTVTQRRFDVRAFSEAYCAVRQASNQAFAELYGVGHEVEVQAAHTDESGVPVAAVSEVRFERLQPDGSTRALVLRGERVVDPELAQIDLNRPPDLHQPEGVIWYPTLGWVTHSSNIDQGRNWFETIAKVVIVGVVAWVSAGSLGAWAASAVGGGLGGAVAAGAAVGGVVSATSGALNGGFNWRNVLQGMVLGGVTGGLTYGVGELAQGAANAQLSNDVLAHGGVVSAAPPATSGVAQGTQTAYGVGRDIVVDLADQALLSNLVSDAQRTFDVVRGVGSVVQGGIVSELAGGEFGDGAAGAFGALAGQYAGGGASSVLAEHLPNDVARFTGGVFGAGVSAEFVNQRGGDGDLAFLNGVVNTAVSFLPPPSRPATEPPATSPAGAPQSERTGYRSDSHPMDPSGEGGGFRIDAHGDDAGTWRVIHLVDGQGEVVRSTYEYLTPQGMQTVHYADQGLVIGRAVTPADGGETTYFLGEGQDLPVTPGVFGEVTQIATLQALGEIDPGALRQDVAADGQAPSLADAIESRTDLLGSLRAGSKPGEWLALPDGRHAQYLSAPGTDEALLIVRDGNRFTISNAAGELLDEGRIGIEVASAGTASPYAPLGDGRFGLTDAVALLGGFVEGIGQSGLQMLAGLVQSGTDLPLALIHRSGFQSETTAAAHGRVMDTIDTLGALASMSPGELVAAVGEAAAEPFIELGERWSRAQASGRTEDWRAVGEQAGELVLEGALIVGAPGAITIRVGGRVVGEVARVGERVIVDLADDLSAGRQIRDRGDHIRVSEPAGSTLYGSVSIFLPDGNSVKIDTTTDAMRARILRGENVTYINPLNNRVTPVQPGQAMAVDHVLPVARIIRLPGFDQLTVEQMRTILHDPDGSLGNLQPLPAGMNSSKWNRSALEWTHYDTQPIDSGYRNELGQRQDRIERMIQARINEFNMHRQRP